MKLLVISILIFILGTPFCSAAVYKCKSESGKLIFKDKPCETSETHENPQDKSLNFKNLQGRWIINTINDVRKSEDNYWEFSEGYFYQATNGRRLTPDTFTVKNDQIDTGYYQIKIIQFDSQTMTAQLGSKTYNLKKIDDSVFTNPSTSQKNTANNNQRLANSAARNLVKAKPKSAQLNCHQAVKNGKEWIESMLAVGNKNYRDGYMSKAEYDSGNRELNKFKRELTLSDCQTATGRDKKFYECISDIRNHVATCAKSYK